MFLRAEIWHFFSGKIRKALLKKASRIFLTFISAEGFI